MSRLRCVANGVAYRLSLLYHDGVEPADYFVGGTWRTMTAIDRLDLRLDRL